VVVEADTALRVEGRITPRLHAELAAAASGQVSEILVREGDQVETGQVILRLGDREQYQAQIAAAEMELLSAQQTLEELEKNAGVELALARQALAEANKIRSEQADEVENLSEPVPQAVLEQTYANLVAAKDRLEKANDNLEYFEKRYRNKNSILWDFMNNKQFKDLLRNLAIARDYAEQRLADMEEKYQDLKDHPDEIALAQAEANLAVTLAHIAEIDRDIAELEKGPDPDKKIMMESQINAAQVSLNAAQTALENSEMVAPFSGAIADLNVVLGEWIEANQTVVVLADFTQWEVETDDLTEMDVPGVRLGQPVLVQADALPELEMKGTVNAIKDLSEEKRGDVTYTVTILLDQANAPLKWGMTVAVEFEE
jgi:multidrug resistance efflux pump